MTVENLKTTILDNDCRFRGLGAGEREMVNRLEAGGFAWLKTELQAEEESLNRRRPSRRPDPADGLVWKSPRNMIGGVRSLADINGFRLFGQRVENGLHMASLVREIGSNHIFARGADRDAIGGVVVGAIGQALPAFHCFGVADLAAVVGEFSFDVKVIS